MSQYGVANDSVFFEVSGWTSPTWKPASGKLSMTSVSPGEEQPPFVLQIETTQTFHGSMISGTTTGKRNAYVPFWIWFVAGFVLLPKDTSE